MISDIPAEWMRAELSGSMAKFPKARAALFWTVSMATFLFKMSTEESMKNVKGYLFVMSGGGVCLWFKESSIHVFMNLMS